MTVVGIAQASLDQLPLSGFLPTSHKKNQMPLSGPKDWLVPKSPKNRSRFVFFSLLIHVCTASALNESAVPCVCVCVWCVFFSSLLFAARGAS